ncbi:MAG: ferritin [Planctomycetes bacterium]|nr:ferritin [Planctomycetota bacterium]
MALDQLKKIMEESVRREIAVSVGYLWQHVKARGIKGIVVRDILKETAIEEMKHAEALAERMAQLDWEPPTDPTPIRVGTTVKEFGQIDVEEEKKAIALYEEAIKVCREVGDEVTRMLYMKILKDEVDHLSEFENFLED